MQEILTNDSELVELLKMGDQNAFQEIYDRYWKKLYRAAVSKVRASENAKEIVQDIFMDLWQRREDISINELEPYLFTAIKYKVLDFYKKEILRKQYAQSIHHHATEADSETEEIIAYNELRQSLLLCIDRLPEKTKLIFEMNRIQYKSPDEISQILGVPLRTVEYHITQGLKSLRYYLREYIMTGLLSTIFWL